MQTSEAALIIQFQKRMQRLMYGSLGSYWKSIEAANAVREIEFLGSPECLEELRQQFAACAVANEALNTNYLQWQRSHHDRAQWLRERHQSLQRQAARESEVPASPKLSRRPMTRRK